MPKTDPVKRDVAAAKAELMAVYEMYGRTDEIALQRGGQAYVRARIAEVDRINDVYAECELLDQPLPEVPDAAIVQFACLYRRRGVS